MLLSQTCIFSFKLENCQRCSSYRPISLLSAISKLFDRVILTRIHKHLEEHNILPDEQDGFRAFRSTTHQLYKTVNRVKEELTDKSSTGMILLDIEKAFDRVWHNGLVFKLIINNFPSYIIKIINAFLHERKFKVMINNRPHHRSHQQTK